MTPRIDGVLRSKRSKTAARSFDSHFAPCLAKSLDLKNKFVKNNFQDFLEFSLRSGKLKLIN
jgi:hypothetical protein